MESSPVYNIGALNSGPSLQWLFSFGLRNPFRLLLSPALGSRAHSHIAGAPLRLLPVSNSWVGELLVSWLEQVEAMSVCRAKLIFLFLLASRASLPSSLMDGSSLGRLFFPPACVSIQKKQCNVFFNLIKLHFTLEKWPGGSLTAWVWNMTAYGDVAKTLFHAYSPELEGHMEAQCSARFGRKVGEWGHLAP